MEYHKIKLKWNKIEKFLNTDTSNDYKNIVNDAIHAFVNYDNEIRDITFDKTKWFDILSENSFVKKTKDDKSKKDKKSKKSKKDKKSQLLIGKES